MSMLNCTFISVVSMTTAHAIISANLWMLLFSLSCMVSHSLSGLLLRNELRPQRSTTQPIANGECLFVMVRTGNVQQQEKPLGLVWIFLPW